MVHTHLHSMYSLRDSIIRPQELVNRIKEIGQTAVAVTDHGTSLGGVSIYQLLKKNGIKYIHGCELYTCDNLSEKNKDNRYYHLVVLCKNDMGRININRLISESGKPENFYYKPRIDFDLLCKYKEGLLITSACMAGEISRYILTDYEKAKSIAQKYRSVFGEDYYLEIQAHNDEEQIIINKKTVELSRELNIPIVVTCDAHYVYESDKKYQNKYAFGGSYKEDGEAYTDCFVQSEAEVRERLTYLPADIVDEAINNTDVIAGKCNVEMPISAPIMPEVPTPKEFKDNTEWLVSLCKQGARKKLNFDFDTYETVDTNKTRKIYDENTGEFLREEPLIYSKEEKDVYVNRFEYELDKLVRMGFVDYILLVYSYSSVGKRRGIARGSGGGSLINYLTDITKIDPIVHGLYFERFIDVGALDLLENGEITKKELKVPDIDLDFSNESCTEVLRWMYEQYGENRVASIGKFGTNQTKGTIRDMCKVLDISLEDADKIAKSFGEYELDEILSMINGDIPQEVSAQEAIKNVQKYPELFDYVKKLNGLPKSFGLHACGKIISTRDLDDFLPSCYDSNGIRYLQGDMHDVEDVGLVKVDVLGLRTLDQEYDTLEMSGETEDFIDPAQNFNDKKVLDIFRNGDTVGVFQFSSNGMKQTIKKMNVKGINDLSIANALFRPGSLKYIDNFCKRRTGEEDFEYLHPDLEHILNFTYGIMVFQEQLIEIGRLAKIHNPDLLRKATGKKNPKLLVQVKPELEQKLKQIGWNSEQFDSLWSQMLEFAKYSFNKAHSSAYAIIAYMTAKQKAYYPAEFYAGLCNSYIGKSSFVKDNAEEIITDLEEHNVKIEPFNFRNDHRRCFVKDGKILYGIPLIKDCSELSANAMYECSDRVYKNFIELLSDLISKGVTKNQIEIFIKLGFFSEFGNSKHLLSLMRLYEKFKNGEAKSIDKTKAGAFDEILSKYCKTTEKTYTITNSKIKETQKLIQMINKKIKNGDLAEKYTDILDNYREIVATEHKSIMDNILNDCVSLIMSVPTNDFTYKEKIADHKQYLGFINLTTNCEADRRKLLVTKVIPLLNKETKKAWGYAVLTKSVGSGKNSRLTVRAKTFESDPIKELDIVYAKSVNKNQAGYWYLVDYEKIFD